MGQRLVSALAGLEFFMNVPPLRLLSSATVTLSTTQPHTSTKKLKKEKNKRISSANNTLKKYYANLVPRYVA